MQRNAGGEDDPPPHTAKPRSDSRWGRARGSFRAASCPCTPLSLESPARKSQAVNQDSACCYRGGSWRVPRSGAQRHKGLKRPQRHPSECPILSHLREGPCVKAESSWERSLEFPVRPGRQGRTHPTATSTSLCLRTSAGPPGGISREASAWSPSGRPRWNLGIVVVSLPLAALLLGKRGPEMSLGLQSAQNPRLPLLGEETRVGGSLLFWIFDTEEKSFHQRAEE